MIGFGFSFLNKKKSLSCCLFSCRHLHFLNTPLFFGTHWTCLCFSVLQGTSRVKLTASISCLQKQNIISIISALREGLLEKVIDCLLLWICLRKQNRTRSTSILSCKTVSKIRHSPYTVHMCAQIILYMIQLYLIHIYSMTYIWHGCSQVSLQVAGLENLWRVQAKAWLLRGVEQSGVQH